MPLIRVSTRAIGATDTEPDRIAVTFSTGESGTFPYPYSLGLDGVGAHEHCIAQLISRDVFEQIESIYKVGETERGYKFTIFLKEKED